MFLYCAVSSPRDRPKRFILYFPDRYVHSDTISASLGSIQPYVTINARRLLIYISTTVYNQVLIYTAELNKLAREREPEALPMSHCALYGFTMVVCAKSVSRCLR